MAEGAVISGKSPKLKKEDDAAIVGSGRTLDKETGHKILVQLSKWESKLSRQDMAAKSIFGVQSLDRRKVRNGTVMREDPAAI